MARPSREPATCALHRSAPVAMSTASSCPEAKGKITCPPATAGAETPVTPEGAPMPETVHSTLPSSARTAQPVALRAAT